MQTTLDQIDVRASASSVLAALTDLQGYLSAAVNPDRIALADLEMEPMGWTRHAYSRKAFEIWQAQLRLFPDDPLLLHHMAIMHHARAFDLEAGPRPSESDADWEAAMGCWHRLHGMDAFWDGLAAKACAGKARQDAIIKLRSDFPQMILAIHYDIALDKETREKRPSRAKFHIAMVHKSPFDARERAQAQRAAYNQYITVVPDEVWQPGELREDVLDKGQSAIVEYLNFDPGCVPALEDALRLQRRVQRSRNTLWRSLDEQDPKRLKVLALEKKDAEAWRPFFDQLVAVVDQLDDAVREDLARWYHGRGGDLHALGEHEKAIEFYERAAGVRRPDDEGRKEHVRELVQTMAFVAREKVAQEDKAARKYCDKVNKRDDLTTIACWLLGQAYARLEAFDVALSVCDRGLAIEPDFDDLEGDTWLGRLSELKGEIPLLQCMSAGRNALKAGKPQDALQPLTRAAKLAEAAGTLTSHNSIYWLRCQAYLAVDKITEARRDVELYHGLLDETSSPTDIEAGRKLREIVAAQERMDSVKPLLEKAKTAMDAGRFQDALAPLDEAARKSPRMDVIFFLRAQALCAVGRIADAKRDAKTVAELAETDDDRKHLQVLNEGIARAEAASVINGLLSRARKAMEEGRFGDALPPLNDAAKKAPRNGAVFFLRAQAHLGVGNVSEARRDAGTVADLAETAEDRRAAAELQKMIDQNAAGVAVHALVRRATEAMQRQSFREALAPLDEAARQAPNQAAIYFLRAQARMATQDFAGAISDATTFENLARSSEEKEAAQRLKKALFGNFA